MSEQEIELRCEALRMASKMHANAPMDQTMEKADQLYHFLKISKGFAGA